VYEEPVTYEAPVFYAAPVIYQAPVYYNINYTPYDYASYGYGCPQQYYPYQAPNVIYFGGGHSTGYYQPQCENSSVIYFGRGEASRRGYRFNHYR
jgi:hypothetical protein